VALAEGESLSFSFDFSSTQLDWGITDAGPAAFGWGFRFGGEMMVFTARLGYPRFTFHQQRHATDSGFEHQGGGATTLNEGGIGTGSYASNEEFFPSGCQWLKMSQRLTGNHAQLVPTQVSQWKAQRLIGTGAFSGSIEQSRLAVGGAAFTVGLAWRLLGLVWRAAAEGDASEVIGSGLSRARVAEYARGLAGTFYRETSIDAAAARLGLGRRRFTTLFREETGRTWLRAVRELRLEHARRLLRETERSVVAVAFESGFTDLSHFHRVFRESTGGVSPEAWRRKQDRAEFSGKLDNLSVPEVEDIEGIQRLLNRRIESHPRGGARASKGK
jgi:AraC-like DNA-binding protein